MATPKPPCATLYPWLRANLGKRVLAPLTGCDDKALKAAVHLAVLYNYCDDTNAVAAAFSLVVNLMQRSTRWLAFHAIAHVADWSLRAELWHHAGLVVPENLRPCSYEPGGTMKDMSRE